MAHPIAVPDLVEEWLKWAAWVTVHKPTNGGAVNSELIGWSEFDWAVADYPEHAWQAILAVVADPRAQPFLGLLAAGPIEDLLSLHGEQFISRIDEEARVNAVFAEALNGVWRSTISDDVWERFQEVRVRRRASG